MAARRDTRPALSLFALGLGVGFLMFTVMTVSIGKAVQKRGITIRIDTAPIAAQVEAEVRSAIRQEVPATLASMKQDLPARVADETARKLSQTTVNVAGFNLPVPEAATQQVRSGVESAVRAGLNVAVTDADLNGLADRLSKRAGGLVQDKLTKYLGNRTFRVELWKGFELPVTIVPEK